MFDKKNLMNATKFHFKVTHNQLNHGPNDQFPLILV
jgi:hypothetical protein